MTLTLDRDPFLAAVSKVIGCVDRRATIAVITHIAVDPAPDGVRLTATNLDMQATTFCPARGSLDPFTLPAATVLDILNNLPSGADINLARDETDPRIILKSGRSRFKLPTLQRDNMPTMDAPTCAHVTVKAADLTRALDAVSYAASTEQTRFVLTGVYTEGGKEFAATDANSIGCAWIEVSGETGSAILAPGFVREAVRLMGDGEVELAVEAGKCSLRLGDTLLIAKVIDGTYVDYKRARPKPDKALTVGREACMSAVRRALIMATDKDRSIKLNMRGGSLAIVAKGADTGEADNEIEADWPHDDMTVRVNGDRLINALSHVNGDTVAIGVTSENKPLLIVEGDRWAGMGVLRG